MKNRNLGSFDGECSSRKWLDSRGPLCLGLAPIRGTGTVRQLRQQAAGLASAAGTRCWSPTARSAPRLQPVMR